MTIARTMLIGGLGAAGALLGIVAPGILKLLVAIAWGIVVFVAVQAALAGVLALVVPAALFPREAVDERADLDEFPAASERRSAPAAHRSPVSAKC